MTLDIFWLAWIGAIHSIWYSMSGECDHSIEHVGWNMFYPSSDMLPQLTIALDGLRPATCIYIHVPMFQGYQGCCALIKRRLS